MVTGTGGAIKKNGDYHAYFSGPLAGGNLKESAKVTILMRCM